MFRFCAAICLLVVLTICASGDEFNGLNSRAFDISASFSSNLEHGVAFTSMDPSGRANGITVQSRSLGGVISCTVTLPLPRDYRGRVAQQVSHPALSTSGWLFVSANVNASPEDSNEWRLYALQHTGAHQCSGWSNTWRQVGAAFDGVNSAPDAVVALGVYTLVFVTDRRGAIVYSTINSAHPEPAWSRFYPLSAGSNNPLFAAASKPAVGIYLDGVPRVHVFWLNRSYEYVNHVSGTVSLIGDLVTAMPDQRRIEDGSGPTRARTGCTVAPEIRPTNPFFVVCGNSREGSATAYSIAHYRQPRSPWNSSAVTWVGRSAYGGFSAPSVGKTFEVGFPFMFVTFGTRYCPEPTRQQPPRPPIIAASCFRNDQWLIQKRYSNLSGWEPVNDARMFRAFPLY